MAIDLTKTGWQGNFYVKVVQASQSGQMFFKIANDDGSINNTNPVFTAGLPESAAGHMLNVLLFALNSQKKVKLDISSFLNSGWIQVVDIQVGEGDF